MKKNHLLGLLFCFTALFSTISHAEEEEGMKPQFGYFTLAPDLTTNFMTAGKKLGYIQVRVDIMVANNLLLSTLEMHTPLIRDALVEILGQQPEDKIKSLAGREEIRKTCLEHINALLLAETGKTVITDLLFTKYLYQ